MSLARHGKRWSKTDTGFGYQLVGQPRRIALEDREAAIVRRIFDFCAVGGCLRCMRDSIKTEFNIEISIRNLYEILRDNRYLGLVSSDGFPYLRDDLAIVDVKTYSRAQRMLGPVGGRRKVYSETSEQDCACQGYCHQTNGQVEPVPVTEVMQPKRPFTKHRRNVKPGGAL